MCMFITLELMPKNTQKSQLKSWEPLKFKWYVKKTMMNYPQHGQRTNICLKKYPGEIYSKRFSAQ